MKIIQLEAENVKRIKAVQIKPDGAIVEITGKNGQGKTSVLDAIWWACVPAQHIEPVPIRKGAERASIKLDLGTLKITRTFRAKEDGDYTTQLRVENEEGARYSKPQEMLDKLVGALSFDPFAFTRMKPKDQFNACRQLVEGFDFDANATRRKGFFDSRTDVNRDAKALRAQAEGIEIDLELAEAVAPDVSEMVAKLQAAGEHNTNIERRRANREQAARDIADLQAKAQAALDQDSQLKAQIEALQKRREELNAEAARLAGEAVELQKKLDEAPALPAPIDAAELTAQIDAARGRARAIEANAAERDRRAKIIAQAKAREEEAEALTAKIEACDQEKVKAIAAAKLPVPGLGFGEDVVLFDGFPLEQASAAAKLRVSCAVAAALNPKLRVLRVMDGALLDDDSMKLLGEFAVEHDMQIWIETVSSGRPGAVVIEDGAIAGAVDTEAA